VSVHTGRSVADLGIATTQPLAAGVVFRHEAALMDVSTPIERRWSVGVVAVTARFGHDEFTWEPKGDVPAIGSTVWMEVAS
jgi:hypothetical protein